MPTKVSLQLENILDKRVQKKTRGKEYFEYFVKWVGHQMEDSIWLTATMLQKSGTCVEELMDRSP